MEDVSNLVARQYEAFAYPEPFADLAEEIGKGYYQVGDPALYGPLLWPRGRPNRRLSILVAGCGTVQAAYAAYMSRQDEVVGLDLSEASLAHERYLQERHGLANLKLFRGNLIEVGELDRQFDVILCTGVLHHMKDPAAGLSALRDVLAPEPLGETVRTEVEDLTALLKGNLEKVVQHGQRADGIVKSMLEHSRGSSDERRTVDLNALIDEALNLAYHGARAQDQSFNITLERNFGEGIAPIEVNPQDMTRVFLNIFSNGFYAVTKKARNGGDAGFVPTLKVTTRAVGEAVEIRVRDNGTGIPAEIRDKLFQPFFTTKPTGEGTGLGLSITYDIVTQQHGGSIAVDSKVGEYSEFTRRLPRNP